MEIRDNYMGRAVQPVSPVYEAADRKGQQKKRDEKGEDRGDGQSFLEVLNSIRKEGRVDYKA